MEKRSRAIALLCFALFCIAGVIHVEARSPEDFIVLQQRWAEARKARDVAFLERFYAKEFTVGNMDGSESSREQDIAMFSTGDLHPAVIADTQMKVIVFGKGALVTGLEHLEGSYKGHTGQFDLRFANTYVLRDGRWQLLRHQATPVPNK